MSFERPEGRGNMSQNTTTSQLITQEVTSWPGVTAGYGRRGEWAFRVGRREIGHLHGDRAAHFMFSRELGTALKAEGRVGDHPVFPGKPGPASRVIEDEDDIPEVIELMRLNYDRIVERLGILEGAS
jgi:Family of unknown function (DUF5519)